MFHRLFEIIPGVFAWSTLIGLILLSWKLPIVVVIFIVLYDLYWFLKTVYLFFHLRYSFNEMRCNIKIDWLKKIKDEKRGSWEDIKHLVVFPMLHESYDVVRSSFLSLFNSNYPKEKMIVVLACETRGGDEDREVAFKIQEEFKDNFYKFFVTFHPHDIPGELAGKGSNETWAVKEVKEKIIDIEKIPYEKIIVSVFDIDTRPGKEYFGILTHKFLSVEDNQHASYQPIPLFTNNFYGANAFARLIGFSSTFWQLMQQSKPEQLVTFSSHSMPFRALTEIGYWHTNIVSEDSRIFFQCLVHYKGKWRVEPLLYPISMDLVTGNGIFSSFKNLYKQQRRWAWGIENFPYLADEFRKNKDIPMRVKRFWMWQQFDGFYSWSTSSFVIFLFGWMPNILGSDIFRSTLYSYNLPRITGWLINLSSIGIITSALFSMILLPPRVDNKRYHALLYLLQWFLMPFTFIIFGSMPALESQTRLLLGGKFRLGFWKTPKAVEKNYPQPH